MKPAIVWFKRDLRVFDHAPLVEAARSRQVVPLYVYEPELIQAPDFSTQHFEFLNECLADLDQALASRGSPLQFHFGAVTEALTLVLRTYGAFTLYSHEETGNAISHARDKRVAAWCKENGILWKEFPSNGVVRGLQSRDDWASIWLTRMKPPPLAAPDFLGKPVTSLGFGKLIPATWLGLRTPDKPQRQHGGRKQAARLVKTFFDAQLAGNHDAMDSPPSADESRSQLSPYLAYGVLSIRELVHSVWKTRTQLHALPADMRPAGTLARLTAFESQLRWHCHFIQTLESEPEIETRNMHRGFDNLREPHFNRAYFERWRNGETGFPLVDAGMKMLAETGWISFQMRALLISFSSHQLWNHWQEPALHLARELLDYEPGIHYSQVQRLSGVTGIHTLRIDNPVKLARDRDPEGVFVKRWLPALRDVPTEFIFEPWTMPAALQQQLGVIIGRDYPEPVVDPLASARQARATLAALRRTAEVREQALRVFEKHGSRNPRRAHRPRSTRAVHAPETAPSADGEGAQANGQPHTPQGLK